MKLKIVITEYCIKNPAWRSQHYGYLFDDIIINLAFC